MKHSECETGGGHQQAAGSHSPPHGLCKASQEVTGDTEPALRLTVENVPESSPGLKPSKKVASVAVGGHRRLRSMDAEGQAHLHESQAPYVSGMGPVSEVHIDLTRRRFSTYQKSPRLIRLRAGLSREGCQDSPQNTSLLVNPEQGPPRHLSKPSNTAEASLSSVPGGPLTLAGRGEAALSLALEPARQEATVAAAEQRQAGCQVGVPVTLPASQRSVSPRTAVAATRSGRTGKHGHVFASPPTSSLGSFNGEMRRDSSIRASLQVTGHTEVGHWAMQKVNKEAKRTSTPGLARQLLPSSLRAGAGGGGQNCG